MQSMIILGIETSCDETAAAVLEQKNRRIYILSNVVASSASLQSKYGGIIPEQAAREQIKSIIPVITEALTASTLYPPSSKNHLPSSTIYRPAIDAIAVTQGPGLIGSLLVGVETAKTLATIWNKPLIPVNHLIGHFYANWVQAVDTPGVSAQSTSGLHTGSEPRLPTFPCIGLLVSGGHTDLVLFTDHGKYKYLGGTRDDAAGECFDKCARLLGLPYPGGPEISRLAARGKDTYKLPRPMIDSGDFDFSFSGLKTAVANLLHTWEVKSKLKQDHTSQVELGNLCASIEVAIVDVLVSKTVAAARKYNIEQIMVAGGVAANQSLLKNLKLEIRNWKLKAKLFVPPPSLCTDNAAMIASAAFFQDPIKNPLNLQANPNLSLAY